MSVVYDAGVLIAADRNDRDVWADHRARLELGLVPVTTAPVVAQVSRQPQQAQLRRFLRGCDVQPFLPVEAHEVGGLLARSGTADVVDGHVAITAARTGSDVKTADVEDIKRLSDHLPAPVRVLPVHGP
jgi:predicted nucleic acid-binding protein